MLDIFGSGYVIEHCISAFLERQKEKACKTYMADCVRLICENVAKIGTIEGRGKVDCKYISARLSDILTPKKKEDKTGNEIVNDILDSICKGGEKD